MRYCRKFIFPLILASGFASFYFFNLDAMVEWANVVDHYRELKLYSQNNIYLSQLVFCVLYFLSVVFCLPIVLVFTLIGGAMFGWIAFLLIVPVATMGCCVVFFASKGVLLDFYHDSNHFITWQEQFKKYQVVVKESGMSLLEYALNFVLNIQEIDKVLVGVNSEVQLDEIMQSVKIHHCHHRNIVEIIV